MTNDSTKPAGARERIEALFGTYTGLDPSDVGPQDTRWPGYAQTLERAREKSGEREAVVCAVAQSGGREIIVVSFDFRFVGGSLGERTGQLIELAAREALSRRATLVSLTVSGGARMQEGMLSLLQMKRMATACVDLRQAGVPHLSVVEDPTTGGVWVALAALADVILATPGATVAFAGDRARGGDFGDPEAYTAEGKFEAGTVDAIVPAGELRDTVAEYLSVLHAAQDAAPEPAPAPQPAGLAQPPKQAWEAVQAARDPARPRARAYLEQYFDSRVTISGDRCGGSDPGVICGIGRHEGQRIAFLAQTGSSDTPAGFRTARRVLALAERLNIAMLTLIDTPGADPGPASERAGLGTAVAELFAAMARPRVPVTTAVIGEGGSGGALAFAGPGPMHLMPDSYFAVIAPEMAAAILLRDRGKAQEIAPLMRLTVSELEEDGLGTDRSKNPDTGR